MDNKNNKPSIKMTLEAVAARNQARKQFAWLCLTEIQDIDFLLEEIRVLKEKVDRCNIGR